MPCNHFATGRVHAFARKCAIQMPDHQKNFEVMMESDPVYGSIFRDMRTRPPELVKLLVMETAAYLKKSVRTIRRWEAEGKTPPRFKVGRERRYRLVDIQDLATKLPPDAAEEPLAKPALISSAPRDRRP